MLMATDAVAVKSQLTEESKCTVIATFGLFAELNCLLQQPHLCFTETRQFIFNIYTVTGIVQEAPLFIFYLESSEKAKV